MKNVKAVVTVKWNIEKSPIEFKADQKYFNVTATNLSPNCTLRSKPFSLLMPQLTPISDGPPLSIKFLLKNFKIHCSVYFFLPSHSISLMASCNNAFDNIYF